MNDNHDQHQREETAREARREFVRFLATVLLVSDVIALLIAGALKWTAQPCAAA